MYIPEFALRETERQLQKQYLNRPVSIMLSEKINAYLVDKTTYDKIINFVENFRLGQEVAQDFDTYTKNSKADIKVVTEKEINEAGKPSAIPTTSRAGVIRAVAAIFNNLVEVQKIKDPDIKTVAMTSILAASISLLAVSEEYGQRLISILKSKM